MKTLILSNLLLLFAGSALAADPLSKFEHDTFDAGTQKLTVYFFGHASLKRRSEPAGKYHSGVAKGPSPSMMYQGLSSDPVLRRMWMSCAGM